MKEKNVEKHTSVIRKMSLHRKNLESHVRVLTFFIDNCGLVKPLWINCKNTIKVRRKTIQGREIAEINLRMPRMLTEHFIKAVKGLVNS